MSSKNKAETTAVKLYNLLLYECEDMKEIIIIMGLLNSLVQVYQMQKVAKDVRDGRV